MLLTSAVIDPGYPALSISLRCVTKIEIPFAGNHKFVIRHPPSLFFHMRMGGGREHKSDGVFEGHANDIEMFDVKIHMQIRRTDLLNQLDRLFRGAERGSHVRLKANDHGVLRGEVRLIHLSN